MSEQKEPLYKTAKDAIFNRFFLAVLYFTILLVLACLAIFYYLHRRIWMETDFWYPLLHFINNRKLLFFFLFWLIGVFFIFLFYWRRTLSYLVLIAEAGNRLVADDEEFIHFPEELKTLEYQMNQAKQESIKNARNAKEAEQRKNDLIVYLAHDLKTPLTSVIGYLTLLRDESEISKELQKKYIAVALEKAERLEDLINEFFEITRFNLTYLTLEKRRVNLSRMLEQIIFEFQPMFMEKNITYETFIEPDLELVCDVDKMERVFDNLLRNAVNYSFEYGRIRVQAVKKNEQKLSLTFWNTGNTIPEEKLNRIFEQFFRLDSARSSRSGGAGLGLAIAKEIVELHGGTIRAASENEVIEFILELPIEK